MISFIVAAMIYLVDDHSFAFGQVYSDEKACGDALLTRPQRDKYDAFCILSLPPQGGAPITSPRPRPRPDARNLK